MAPTDVEYQRAWRQRQKDIASGKVVVEPRVKPTAAEHQRAYRERLKAKRPSQRTSEEEKFLSDAALEDVILKRGRVLSAMMNTPLSLWPAEWLEDNDAV